MTTTTSFFSRNGCSGKLALLIIDRSGLSWNLTIQDHLRIQKRWASIFKGSAAPFSTGDISKCRVGNQPTILLEYNFSLLGLIQPTEDMVGTARERATKRDLSVKRGRCGVHFSTISIANTCSLGLSWDDGTRHNHMHSSAMQELHKICCN